MKQPEPPPTSSMRAMPPPGCFLIHGGEEIGEEDADSRRRLLDPNEVLWFSAFLTSLTDDEFTRRYDPERMTALEIDPELRILSAFEARPHGTLGGVLTAAHALANLGEKLGHRPVCRNTGYSA